MKFPYFSDYRHLMVNSQCTAMPIAHCVNQTPNQENLPLARNNCSFSGNSGHDSLLRNIVIFPNWFDLLFDCETLNDDTVCKIQHWYVMENISNKYPFKTALLYYFQNICDFQIGTNQHKCWH